MKVYMVTGSAPPAMCGVGDYSVKLVEALRAAGVDAETVTGGSWGLAGGVLRAAELGRREPGVIHVQYPTNGYGHRLGPQVLASLRPGVVTLHEFSNVHVLRRVAEAPFAVFAKHLVFTDAGERDAVARFWPRVRSKASVIAIGSNIESASAMPTHRNREILHFGAIYPSKGVEQVIELSRKIKECGLPFVVRIAGLLKPDHRGYADRLVASTEGLPVEWSFDQPEASIVDFISAAFLAYLPYPDGASERRGSLKAMMLGGLPCITTRGANTPAGLGDAVAFANGPAEGCDLVSEWLRRPERWEGLSARARDYARRYDWEEIATMHRDVYEAL